MKKRLLIINPGSQEEKRVELTKPFYQIGRGADATIRVSNARVSSLHASLFIKDDSVILQDLDSTNGTRVNGKKIKTSDLRDSDELSFADTLCFFQETELVETADHEETKSFRTALSFAKAEISLSEEGTKLMTLLFSGSSLSKDQIVTLRNEWERADRHLKRLDALYQMLETALKTDNKDGFIEELLASVASILGVEKCGLYLRKEELFYVKGSEGLSKESSGGGISASVLAKVLDTGEPVFIDSALNDKATLGFISLTALRIESLLCVPLFDSGRTVCGALYCLSSRAGELGALERDRPFLKAASAVIRLALFAEEREREGKEAAQAEEKRNQEERFLPIIRRLKERNENLSLQTDGRGPFGWDLADNSDLMVFARKAAVSDLPILITGETGTGKSLFSREIHALGRKGEPFVTIDCTTLQPNLIESELFGHEKGAFTGAVGKKPGRVVAAGNGTLFIDEVGELPLDMQGKLLRLLQTGEFEPLGGLETKKCTARLIFATNRDLMKEVRERKFREDLYFRLTVLNIEMPPLRKRPAIIVPLARHFLKQYSIRTKSSIKGFDSSAESALVRHPWPGNIRELENSIARALFNPAGEILTEEDLTLEQPLSASKDDNTLDENSIYDFQEENGGFDLKRARERLDRAYIKRVLVLTKGNVSQSAKKLNISRNSLMELIAKYGL
ncbi:MAG: sigma 54-interacting transcriptional regulator [Fibrobacteres bacterium]|nr:sigma 54-interacting transcriptional regulator [Fibrobacterota bacterium]